MQTNRPCEGPLSALAPASHVLGVSAPRAVRYRCNGAALSTKGPTGSPALSGVKHSPGQRPGEKLGLLLFLPAKILGWGCWGFSKILKQI